MLQEVRTLTVAVSPAQLVTREDAVGRTRRMSKEPSSGGGGGMGGGFIETAISLSLLYLMSSLLCTIVVELGASWLKARSRWLEHALRSLLYVDVQAWSGLAASPPAGLPQHKAARLAVLVTYFKKQ